MHASVYFILFYFFGNFTSIYFCHDLCHAILGKYACIFLLIYEYVNVQEFKCLK